MGSPDIHMGSWEKTYELMIFDDTFCLVRIRSPGHCYYGQMLIGLKFVETVEADAQQLEK